MNPGETLVTQAGAELLAKNQRKRVWAGVIDAIAHQFDLPPVIRQALHEAEQLTLTRDPKTHAVTVHYSGQNFTGHLHTRDPLVL